MQPKAVASWASFPATRKSMLGNRRVNTRPELLLRKTLYRLGLRYRVDSRPLRDMNRRADIVFRPARVAVFVHGCFWHGCPEHYAVPRRNREYWEAKVTANRQRDADTEARLREAGWMPVVVWEHENPREAAGRIAATVKERRPS